MISHLEILPTTLADGCFPIETLQDDDAGSAWNIHASTSGSFSFHSRQYQDGPHDGCGLVEILQSPAPNLSEFQESQVSQRRGSGI
jgi:hypothetical protein